MPATVQKVNNKKYKNKNSPIVSIASLMKNPKPSGNVGNKKKRTPLLKSNPSNKNMQNNPKKLYTFADPRNLAGPGGPIQGIGSIAHHALLGSINKVHDFMKNPLSFLKNPSKIFMPHKTSPFHPSHPLNPIHGGAFNPGTFEAAKKAAGELTTQGPKKPQVDISMLKPRPARSYK